jgi:hypothetical protein
MSFAEEVRHIVREEIDLTDTEWSHEQNDYVEVDSEFAKKLKSIIRDVVKEIIAEGKSK